MININNISLKFIIDDCKSLDTHLSLYFLIDDIKSLKVRMILIYGMQFNFIITNFDFV
jgi:hypothetical protein